MLRYGRTLGFTQVEARHAPNEVDAVSQGIVHGEVTDAAATAETATAGRLVALGRHTKMFPAVGPGSAPSGGALHTAKL